MLRFGFSEEKKGARREGEGQRFRLRPPDAEFFEISSGDDSILDEPIFFTCGAQRQRVLSKETMHAQGTFPVQMPKCKLLTVSQK